MPSDEKGRSHSSKGHHHRISKSKPHTRGDRDETHSRHRHHRKDKNERKKHSKHQSKKHSRHSKSNRKRSASSSSSSFSSSSDSSSSPSTDLYLRGAERQNHGNFSIQIPESKKRDPEQERQRKLQMRLAKARALKFEKEIVNDETEMNISPPILNFASNITTISAANEQKNQDMTKIKTIDAQELAGSDVDDNGELSAMEKELTSLHQEKSMPDVEELDPLDAYMQMLTGLTAMDANDQSKPILQSKESRPLQSNENGQNLDSHSTDSNINGMQTTETPQNMEIEDEDSAEMALDPSKIITMDEILGNPIIICSGSKDWTVTGGDHKHINGSPDGYDYPLSQAMQNGEAHGDEENADNHSESGDANDYFYQEFMAALKKQNDAERGVDVDLSYKGQFISDDDMMEDEIPSPSDDEHPELKKARKNAERKDVSHIQTTAKEDLLPFRKDFYIECKEIAEQTEEEIQEYRKKLGEISVRGKDVPKPIHNWYQCGLLDATLEGLIKKKQYMTPFPIQCQALPIIMKGRDTIGVAETGSGKTLAYILPMLRHVFDQPPLADGDGPIVLVLAPTRELASQIYQETRYFAKALNMECICIYGGAGIAGQLSELKRGAEIIVATPGRLIDILTTSKGKITNLRRVTFVVIDEADRMLDQGFEPQISRIMSLIRPDRQTVMFSATFPRNVESLAKRILDRPIEVVVGTRGQACTNIEQIIEVLEPELKQLRLLEILGDWNGKGSIIIFVDTQAEADKLFQDLTNFGYAALLLHGGIDPEDRDFTIYDFKKQMRSILVATSVCARGLDIRSCVLVINYVCPNHLEDYIHRIGRTGRAGNKGTAITFITPEEDRFCLDLQRALQMSSQEVPPDLKNMITKFKKKVEIGQAKIYSNRNMMGSGFRFDNEDNTEQKKQKSSILKRFNTEAGISDAEDSDDDILEKKKKQESVKPQRVLTQKEKMHMMKDPAMKKAIEMEGLRAAQKAIASGASADQLIIEAQAAMQQSMEALRNGVRSSDLGRDTVSQLINQFERDFEENSDLITYDFEVNDYPPHVRTKITSNELLLTIRDMTGCNVSVRGTYVEPGKKPTIGQRKQYLHFEGQTDYYVTRGYREAKRYLEEYLMAPVSTVQSQPGRFTV